MNKINEYYKRNNEEEYNEFCIDCPYECKQSYRSKIVSCKLIKKKGLKVDGARQNRTKKD